VEQLVSWPLVFEEAAIMLSVAMQWIDPVEVSEPQVLFLIVNYNLKFVFGEPKILMAESCWRREDSISNLEVLIVLGHRELIEHTVNFLILRVEVSAIGLLDRRVTPCAIQTVYFLLLLHFILSCILVKA
jgi:hypothetical protein